MNTVQAVLQDIRLDRHSVADTAPDPTVASVIVGGGPAGLAPLIAASNGGFLGSVLAGGVSVIERGAAIGAGEIGRYIVASDSTAATIVDCVQASSSPWLAALRHHPTTRAVAAYGDRAVPLPLVGAFLAAVGTALREVIAQAPGCAVLTHHQAIRTQQMADGRWRTELRRPDGTASAIVSQLVVLATGGHQPEAHLRRQEAAGVGLMAAHDGKLVPSGEAMTAAGLHDIAHRLDAIGGGEVAIVGSSSSAIASAQEILRLGDRVRRVTVLHRRPLRVFYPSAAAALADGYDEFGPDDICPKSGFVFRFAGSRLDSRALVMAARGIGGRRPPARLHLHRLTEGPDPAGRAILERADLIVTASGYRPRALTVLDCDGRMIPLFADGPGTRPLVDGACQVLDGSGAVIPGLLGIGLAAGFTNGPEIGGEPSFSGQTNGLWQWHNTIGAIIATRLREAVGA